MAISPRINSPINGNKMVLINLLICFMTNCLALKQQGLMHIRANADNILIYFSCMADREGFEPSVPN